MSLSGKATKKMLSLKGNNQDASISIPEFNSIKTSCINIFLLPLQCENWSTPIENQFLLDIHKQKLATLQLFFKNEEISHYLEIISLLQILLPIYEKWKKDHPDTKNDIISMVYITTMLKIKPEYEIYHQIFGKPNRILNETYNSKHVLNIQTWMKEENITLDKLKHKLSLHT